MIKAVIFDFDGVLADTYKFNKKITEEVGHKVSHEDFKAHHDGNVFKNPKIPFTTETANEFFIKYFMGVNGVKPFFSPNEIKLLREKYMLYIISSTREESIVKFLSHNNLGSFKEVLGARFHKSKVQKFKYLLKKHKLKPESIVFITDTLGDILEGHELKIRTIAVDFGFHERERLERGNPFRIVSNFNEMVKVIDEM